MRFPGPHTRIPVQVQDLEAPEPNRPRRIMTPTAKIIENAAQAACEIDDLGDFALIARDADSIYAAISNCTSNEPKTASAAFKANDAEAWAKALADEVKAHYTEKTLGPALSSLPPGTTAIPIEAIFRTKRDGRKKLKPGPLSKASA
jgi:hypothetical protein